MRLYKIAFNPNIVDKHEGGNESFYKEGWTNIDATVEELIEGQTKDGWATCAQMSGPRCKANFATAEVVSVDIDEMPSLSDILEHPLVKEHAAYAFTTKRHTPDAPRLRVAFTLPRTIIKADEYAAVTTALTLRLGGDPAATDAARISFGHRGAEVYRLVGEGMQEPLLEQLIQQGLAATVKSHDSRNGGTSRSSVGLDADQLVKLASGVIQPLRDTAPKTRAHCPYHNDRHSSAFVVESQKRVLGIRCSTCAQTFWPPGMPEHDFTSFDRTAREAKAYFDRHQDQGVIF